MKKKLSKFICKELLYDYYSGVLDPNRKAQVEAYLKEDAEVKQDLENLELAIRYTQQLKKITLSQPYHQELKGTFQGEGAKYYVRKAAIRTGQGLSLVAVLALFYFFFPAEQIISYFKRDPNKIIIAEIETTTTSVDPLSFAHLEEEPESLLSPDDESEAPTDHGEEVEVKLSPEQEKQLREELEKQEKEQALAAQVESQKPAEPMPSPSPSPTQQKTTGFLYRAYMTVEQRDSVADAITQRIVDLGGQKAGSVEIGWTKPNGNRYFHFSMTESNFEILRTYLGTIVPVDIARSAHPRVMPTGQVRMILEVQAK